jgi:hypothetical protein
MTTDVTAIPGNRTVLGRLTSAAPAVGSQWEAITAACGITTVARHLRIWRSVNTSWNDLSASSPGNRTDTLTHRFGRARKVSGCDTGGMFTFCNDQRQVRGVMAASRDKCHGHGQGGSPFTAAAGAARYRWRA